VFNLQKTSWQADPFPGVVAVLSQLSALHTLVIITSSQSAAVSDALERFGLGDAVSEVMGGESGTSKAERIGLARAAHSADCAETFMVGDAISDVRSGRQAGVRTIAVAWGFQDRELLSKETPDFLAEEPGDLLTFASGEHLKGDAAE
jgi:phosphoglycolate phosphatase-like HAD superfamily hydrolase